MDKYIRIRPHHFLCLPGYKGYSYNAAHTNNWDRISKLANTHQDLRVKIVEGKDSLCEKCPNTGYEGKLCKDGFLNILDVKVKKLLNIENGKIYTYNEIIEKLRLILDPKKHKNLCGECHWREFGLCKDTFKKLKK